MAGYRRQDCQCVFYHKGHKEPQGTRRKGNARAGRACAPGTRPARRPVRAWRASHAMLWFWKSSGESRRPKGGATNGSDGARRVSTQGRLRGKTSRTLVAPPECPSLCGNHSGTTFLPLPYYVADREAIPPSFGGPGGALGETLKGPLRDPIRVRGQPL